MKIHARLIFSYMAMVIIPLILSLIAMFIIMGMQLGSYTQKYHLGAKAFKTITETAVRVSKQVDTAASNTPDKFQNKAYLDNLSDELTVINSGVLVKKGDTFFYTSKNLETLNIIESLEEDKDFDNNAENIGHSNFTTLTVNEKPYTVKINKLTFSDKTAGTVYLVTDVSAVGEFFSKFFSTLGITILFIIIITNGIITFFMARSITKPLRVLMEGTRQIKNGNLNFRVIPRSTDELGELTIAFEQMRFKLKESIDLQLQYEENRKELISSISHDLKTPITAIKGYVEGIVDGVADTPEKMDKYIKTIYTKATDMDKLIDDLFLFSKLDLKKMPFNFEKVNISRYFEDCVNDAHLDLEGKGISISMKSLESQTSAEGKPASENKSELGSTSTLGSTSVTGSTSALGSETTSRNTQPMVLLDREKLKRVVQNILDNSAKYMGHEQGRIEIFLREQQDHITVGIKDDGKGISPEELPHIFDQFYRADPSRNKTTGGSGLGLAIVKQIIEGHGGQVWVESKIGEGTTIFFTLKKVV